MKRTALILFLGMFLATATAQTDLQKSQNDVETVLITSSANYPDTFISDPASETIGAPVLVTEKNNLSKSTSEALERLDVKEAILVGGPAVISENVESEINSKVNSTTRLWGTTQIGTSVEVSKYFWPSSEEATIVQYPQNTENGYKVLSRAADEAEEEPILISKEGTLSASVLGEIERLNTTEVDVLSTNAVNVSQDLKDLGVEDVQIYEGAVEELEKERENEENVSKMVVVAAANFKDVISAQASQGTAFLVDSQEKISNAVEEVKNSSASTVYVTGKPDLASTIADRLRSETNKKIVLVTGKPDRVSSNLTSEQSKEWSQNQDRKLENWREKVKKAPGLRKASNKTIEKAEQVINENSSQEVQNLLQEAKNEHQEGDYFKAREAAVKAYSMARSQNFRTKTRKEIRKEVREEREDLKEAVKELKELSREQAGKLRDAETMNERLEVIKEFRQERKETIQELKEEKRERIQERKERKQERSEKRAEVDSSEVKLEVENNEVKAEVEYTAPTGGYSVDSTVQRSNGSVKFGFNFKPPEGFATQVITDMKERREVKLEDGNYSVNVALRVNGKKINSLEQDITVPGMSQYDSEIEKDEEESDTNETEQENETDNIVTYTDDGFTPQKITIQKGEEVEWKDKASGDMWVASDIHPTHTEYDGTSTSQHCENGESDTFDQCSAGKIYDFKFEKTGEWGYHNHLNAGHTGTVVVE